MRAARGMACLLLGAALAGPAGAADLVFDKAILQGMDKISGQITRIEAPVGQEVRFGTLEMIVRTCRKHPAEETPESAAFIDIWETRPDQPAASLFRGWMFASSPALSALEHPVYDVWVVDCADPVARPADSPLPPADGAAPAAPPSPGAVPPAPQDAPAAPAPQQAPQASPAAPAPAQLPPSETPAPAELPSARPQP